MAEEQDSGQDRTEEATPERREEFRERGQIAVSREVTTALEMALVVAFIAVAFPIGLQQITTIMKRHFESIGTTEINQGTFGGFMSAAWTDLLMIILPVFAVAAGVGVMATLLQTQFNWSSKKLIPDFSRLNILKGVVRIVSWHSLVELAKGIAKVSAVGVVAWLILRGEMPRVPGLVNMPVNSTWAYWGSITKSLFWSVSILMLCIGGADFFYNWITLERKMKMTKQEVKEEYKRREADPHVRARIRRAQRDIANRRMIARTKEATAVITNPTHFAVAVKYELGMHAPIVVAKGVDFLAQRIKEIARENNIPVIENKPLARSLHKLVEVGQEIPEQLYKAVSEIIRYVFQLKGIKVTKDAIKKAPRPSPASNVASAPGVPVAPGSEARATNQEQTYGASQTGV